jgi:hypothetical protein
MCSPTYKGHNDLTSSALSSDQVGRKWKKYTIVADFQHKGKMRYKTLPRFTQRHKSQVVREQQECMINLERLQEKLYFFWQYQLESNIHTHIEKTTHMRHLQTISVARVHSRKSWFYRHAWRAVNPLKEKLTYESYLSWCGFCSFVEINPTPHDTSWRQPCSTWPERNPPRRTVAYSSCTQHCRRKWLTVLRICYIDSATSIQV